MSWFNRKKKESVDPKIEKSIPLKPMPIKPIEYPTRIILAWSESISGNIQISKWLNENGYPELVIAASAIYLKHSARTWLVENGYAHLMAMIHAAEGDKKAQNWLKKHKFTLLYHMAMAIENENSSWIWLKQNSTPDIFILTTKIKTVKDKIEENHNDIHSFGVD